MPPNDLDAYLDPPNPRQRVHSIAARAEIPPEIADDYLKLTKIESGHNVNVRDSSKGAQGFGQVMPDRRGGTTRTVGGRKYNLRDPNQNVEAGLRYFQEGGDDPVARRLYYFGGPRAKRAYERTGRIPNISDGNMTAVQYVRATGASQQALQRPKSLDAYLDPADSTAPPSATPAVPSRKRQKELRAERPSSIYGRAFGGAASAADQESIRKGVADAEARRPLSADEAWSRFTQAVASPATPQRSPREQVRAEVEKEYHGRRGPYASPTASGLLHTLANPVDSLTGLFRSDEENINRETEARLKQQQIAAEPEVESIRREYGEMSAPVRSVAAPVIGRGGGGMLKVVGGIASAFGIAPNRLSEWANKRGEIIEAGANLPPLKDEAGLTSLVTGERGAKEVERGIPEKIATGLVDLGVGLGEIILLRRVTKLPFNQLLALESAARNSDKPLSEQASRTAEAYALGTALDRHLSRPVSAAISGVPTAAQTGYEVSQGRMSPLDAVIQTGIQTASGAILTNPKPKQGVPLRPVTETPAQRRSARIEETEAQREMIRNELQEVEGATPRSSRETEIDAELSQIREQLRQTPRDAPASDLDRRYWDLVAERGSLGSEPRTSQSLEDYLDEPQSKVQPPVEAQRAEAESVAPTGESAPRTPDQAQRPSGSLESATEGVQGLPQRFFHRDFGEVTEAPNQKKAGRGKVKVLDTEGRTHYVKRSDLTGRGNQRMVPVREAVNTPESAPPAWVTRSYQDLVRRSRRGQPAPEQSAVEPSPELKTQPVATESQSTTQKEAASKPQPARELAASPQPEVAAHTETAFPPRAERRGPERVRDTDRLELTPDEQARIRDELGLSQRAPIEPEPAQVDILGESPPAPVKLRNQPERIRPPAPVEPPKTSEQKTTSARAARLVEDRAQLDLPELPPAERKSWQKSLSEAKPEQATRLADQVLNRPRGLSDSETASLVVRAQQVKNEHAAKLREINNAPESDLPRLRSELETIEREFDILSTAAKQSGTEKARALAAQKLTINQDFDLVSMVGRFRSAAGRKETAAERATIEAQSKRVAELETQISEANDRLAQQRLQKQLDKEAARERRRTGRAQSRQALDEEFADLRAQFAQARAEIKNVQASGLAGLDPEGKLTKLIGQMARNRIRAGVTDAAQLVDDVHAAIAEYLPEVSKRDIRDAISGYGVTSKPSAEPVAQRLREVKQLLRDMSALEDIKEGQPPLRSGYQRDKPSQEVRESRRRVQEELRRHPEIEQAMRDPAEQQKTLLDAAKARLRNRIEDLNRLITEGRRESKTPARVTPDGELQQLRQERDRLQGLYDQIPDPGADARAIQRSLAMIEKSVAELERKINQNDLGPRPRIPGPASPELDAARTRRSDLQKELSRLRRIAKQGSPEEQRARQVEAELRKTNKDITDLRRRISTGDVERLREGSRSLWTQELGRTKQERAALQEQVREMRAATPEAKRREAQRKLEAAERSIAELQRKIGQNDLSVRPRSVPETPELIIARQEQKALRSILNDLRLAAKPKLSESEAQARKQLATERAVQTRLDKQIADLEQQMSSGQFREKAEREPPRYTRETYRLQKELEATKAEYERLKYRATATTGQKIKDTALGLGNAPKTLLSMGDFSALLRQGGYNFVTHPILSSRAAVDMVRSMSERGFANVEAEIKNHDLFDESVRNGIEYTGVDRLDPRLNKREEGYLGSGFIDAISKGKYNPLGYTLKPLKDVSERTFVSFLDSQRIRVYAQQANAIRSMKLTPEQTKAALKAQAAFINAATGRGNLGARGNAAAPLLNMAMFSPRLFASRLTLLNKMFNPVAWKNLPPGARKQIMIDNVKFLGFTALTLGLAKAAGLGVSLDPDDSEFLKIKVGNTRYDTLAGLQQPMRLFLRLVAGGNQLGGALRGGETYSGEPASDILLDFARSKVSPEAGYAWDALEGQNRMTGKKFEAGRDAAKLIIPLPFQDFHEAIKTDGAARGFVEALPSLVGIGSQTYQGAAEKPTTHAEKLARRYTREKLPDEARTQQEIDIDSRRSQLRARARKGEDVSGEISTLGAQITDRQAKSILNARNQSRLQEDFNRLGPKEAIIVYGVASPAQKAELRELLQKKSARIDLLPPAEQDEVRRRFEAAGMTRGPLPREPRERRERTERKPREWQGYIFQ